MDVKLIEVRDRSTYIAVMATRLGARSEGETEVPKSSERLRPSVLPGKHLKYSLDSVDANVMLK